MIRQFSEGVRGGDRGYPLSLATVPKECCPRRHELPCIADAEGRLRATSPYCRKYTKEGVVSSDWTPMVNRLSVNPAARCGS